ncbi:MAG: hypothetical protein R2710_03060 [Acidimicrobiales bacterium]
MGSRSLVEFTSHGEDTGGDVEGSEERLDHGLLPTSTAGRRRSNVGPSACLTIVVEHTGKRTTPWGGKPA